MWVPAAALPPILKIGATFLEFLEPPAYKNIARPQTKFAPYFP